MGSVCDGEFPLMNFRSFRNSRRKSPKRLTVGFANVRSLKMGTMLIGQQLESWGLEKIEVLKQRMREQNLYWLGLAETRLEGTNVRDCGDGFLLLHHNKENTKGQGGVGILLSPAAAKAWKKDQRSYHHPSGRVISCSLPLEGAEGHWHAVVGYGPAQRPLPQKSEERKERKEYLQACQETIQQLKAGEIYLFVADMNCRVGTARAGEDGFRQTIGNYGMGKRNEAGEEMLDFCLHNNIKVANTFFPHKTAHKATWTHPRFHTPAILDYAMTRTLRFVEDVRTMPGVDIDSDHKLLRIKLVSKPEKRDRKKRVSKRKRLPRIAVDMPRDSPKWTDFGTMVRDELKNITDVGQMCTVIRECAEETLGVKPQGRQNWRIGRETEIAALHEKRAEARRKLQSQPSQRNAGQYKAQIKASRQAVKQMVNEWWQKRLETIEEEANRPRSTLTRCDQKFNSQWGVQVHVPADGIPFESRATMQHRHGPIHRITDIEYADDTATVDTDWDRFQRETELIDQVITEWGGEMSLPKSEWLWVPGLKSDPTQTGPQNETLLVRGRPLPRVPRTEQTKDGPKEINEFKYLGSLLAPNEDLGVDADINRRLSLASMSFAKLRPVWESRILTKNTKTRMFKAVVATTLLWGAEAWPITSSRKSRLRRFWNRCCRNLLGISWSRMWNQHISHDKMHDMLKVEDIVVTWERKITRWMGHTSRMPPNHLPAVAMFGHVINRVAPSCMKKAVGMRKTWTSTASHMITELGLQKHSWRKVAEERDLWRRIIHKNALSQQDKQKLEDLDKEARPFACE